MASAAAMPLPPLQVGRQAGVGQGADRAFVHCKNSIGRFHEEKRRLTAAESHFLGMFCVIAAHAIDAMDWKPKFGAAHRHAGHRSRGKHIRHARLSSGGVEAAKKTRNARKKKQCAMRSVHSQPAWKAALDGPKQRLLCCAA